ISQRFRSSSSLSTTASRSPGGRKAASLYHRLRVGTTHRRTRAFFFWTQSKQRSVSNRANGTSFFPSGERVPALAARGGWRIFPTVRHRPASWHRQNWWGVQKRNGLAERNSRLRAYAKLKKSGLSAGRFRSQTSSPPRPPAAR